MLVNKIIQLFAFLIPIVIGTFKKRKSTVSSVKRFMGITPSPKTETPKCLELALGLSPESLIKDIFLPRGTRLPASRRKIYYTDRRHVPFNIVQGDPEDEKEPMKRVGVMWLKHIPQDNRYHSLISVRMAVDKDGTLEVSAQYLNEQKKVTKKIGNANRQLPSYELTWFDLLPMRIRCYIGGSFIVLGGCVVFSLTSVFAAMFYVPVFAYERLKNLVKYHRKKGYKQELIRNLIDSLFTVPRILRNHWFSLIYMTAISLIALYIDFLIVKLFYNRLAMIAQGLRLQKRLIMWIRSMVR
jgi:hypothetical protein